MAAVLKFLTDLFTWIKAESAGEANDDVDEDANAQLAQELLALFDVPLNSTAHECHKRMADHGFSQEERRSFADLCSDHEKLITCPAAAEIVFRIAKKFKLPLGPLSLTSKYSWFDQLTTYDKIVSYYFDKSSVMGHWKLLVVTDTGVYILVELKAYTQQDALSEHFRHIIAQLNANKPLEPSEKVIIPNIVFGASATTEEIKAMRKLRDPVPFQAFMAVVMLDPAAFSCYNLFTNNCQQYVRRIYRAILRPFATKENAREYERMLEEQRNALARDQPRLQFASSVERSGGDQVAAH